MLTIGEFAKQGGVSRRMLRHYDKLGLLCPAHTGEYNGYRYYDPAQISVLLQIESLKAYGFALSEIAGLLPLPQEALAERIHVRRLKAYEELYTLRKSLRQMEEDMTKMEGIGMNLDKYHVIEMDAPAQKVFSIRRTIHISEFGALFEDLRQEMEKRGIKRTGPTQSRFLGTEFSYENMDIEAQAQVSQDGEGIFTLPAGKMIATIHVGPNKTVKYAYDAISDWMGKHPQYRVCGPAIERYLKDEAMVNSPEELETGVLFPVELVEDNAEAQKAKKT